MSNITLGPAELGFIAVYLLSLIGIGYCGMRARTENSLKEHACLKRPVDNAGGRAACLRHSQVTLRSACV